MSLMTHTLLYIFIYMYKCISSRLHYHYTSGAGQCSTMVLKRPSSCTTSANPVIKRPASVMKRPASARRSYKNRAIDKQKKRWAVARARKKAAFDPTYVPRAGYIKRVIAVEAVAREARGVAGEAKQLSQEAKSESSDAMNMAIDADQKAETAMVMARQAAQATGLYFCTP